MSIIMSTHNSYSNITINKNIIKIQISFIKSIRNKTFNFSKRFYNSRIFFNYIFKILRIS